MINPLKEFYTEQYYIDRGYTFENRMPIIRYIAQLFVDTFKPKTSLDVGCAKGYLVRSLLELGVDAYGFDISAAAVHSSPDLATRLHVADAEYDTFAFPEKHFDLITSTECMEHLIHPEFTVREMSRVIKTGGFVLISSPAITVWRKLYQALFGGSVLHPSELKKEEWISIFEEYGFYYMCDLFDGLKHSEKKEYKKRLKVAATGMPPALGVGRVLCKLGKAGNNLRAELNLLVWKSQNLIFIKE